MPTKCIRISRGVFVCLLVVLLSGCGAPPAAVNLPVTNRYAEVKGVFQLPVTTAWRYVWKESYGNQIIPCRGTVQDNILYQGGQGLLELDIRTGMKVLDVSWTAEHHFYLTTAPIVWQNRLYGILSEQKPTEIPDVGLLYERLACLDATTGRILWQSEEVGTWEEPCGCPLLLDGKIYMAACFPIPPPGKFPEFDVHAAVGIWDMATGKLTGRIPLPHGSYPGLTQLVSDGTSLYGNAHYNVSRGHYRSSIFRYDPSTDKTVWSVNYPVLPNDLINATYALAVDNGTLIVVSRVEESSYYADGTTTDLKPEYHMAAAFDTADGHELWSKSGLISSDTHLKSDQKPEIATRDGLAFLSIQDDGSLVALDERTGEEKWSFTVEKSRIESGPSIDGTPFYWYYNLIPMATANLLYVREGDSALLAVDPDTGTELWRKTLLTREELANEVKNLCDVIPVNDGILVVTDDAMDMYPIVELWQ